MDKYKEAIKAIKSNYPPSNYTMLREGLELAIKTLEKQIPKKPIYKVTDSTGNMFYDCQVCGEYVTHSETQAKENFCSNCGQKLDWEDE